MSTSRTAVIGSPVGLHARPAAIFVKAVTASGHAVSLHKADQSANAASILSVLGLKVGNGDQVIITVDGAEPDRVADELQALLERDLDAR